MGSRLHPDNDLTINPTQNDNINAIIETHKLSRRSMLKGTFGATISPVSVNAADGPTTASGRPVAKPRSGVVVITGGDGGAIST